MAEGDLKKFDFKAFAKDLAGQASQVIPQDIGTNDKKFIVEIIARFCMIAGDALIKEENSPLTAQEASIVVQFIGEWIFHKSIDIIRANIEPQLREGILQKVAFTVFDIAKKAVERKLPQEQLISLVEAQVKKCFEKALADLAQRGAITKETTQNALSQSNIDSMATAENTPANNTPQEEANLEIMNISDAKIIKLASLAVLIKNFPEEKIKNILQKFNKPERDVLLKYLKMPDLNKKLDAKTTVRCLEEIKNALPEEITVNFEKAFQKMYKIVKNMNQKQILNIIEKERPAIKEYVSSCWTGKRKKIPAHIANVVSKYLEEKIS